MSGMESARPPEQRHEGKYRLPSKMLRASQVSSEVNKEVQEQEAGSTPDSGLGVQVKVLRTFQVAG